MAKRLEQRLSQVAELRKGEPTPAAIQTLEGFLLKEDGPVVARVAELMVEWGLFDQGANLAQAFIRLLEAGMGKDAQCWGKLALVKALQALSWHDPEVYVLGCRSVQMEPVWGGQEDSATPLRAASAVALCECPGVRYETLLDVLVHLLADPAWNVRASAASAIAQVGYPQGAPLLKLRVLLGDTEPRVIGACLDGLLHLSKTEAIPFIQGLLAHADAGVRLEAVCTLAAAHLPEAVKVATEAWKNFPDPRSHKAIVAALASSPTLEATDFLSALLAQENRNDALLVMGALAPRLRESEIREKVEHAIGQNPNKKIREELEALL